MTTIYALCDPMTHEIRYVGKTYKTVKHRLATHCSDKRNTHRANWVRSLKPLKPEILELELIGDDEWVEAEQFWIAYFKTLGAKLTNLTKGGEGCVGYTPTPETLLKMSAVQKGNKYGLKYDSSVVFSLRISGLSYQNISKITGISKSQVTRLCIAKYGNASIEDTKLKLSVAGKGNDRGKHNTGRKLSSDTKAKISQAIKRNIGSI